MATVNGHIKTMAVKKPEPVRESYGGEIYEYYPLSKHVVAAPSVCGGRATFKYTRLEVRMILTLLAEGYTIAEIVDDYEASHLSTEAVTDAIHLANQALFQMTESLQYFAPRPEFA